MLHHGDQTLDVIANTQQFHFASFRDAQHFAELLTQSSLSDAVKTAAQAVVDHISSGAGVVVKSGVINQVGGEQTVSNAHGVSVFAPTLKDLSSHPHLVDQYIKTLTYRQRQSAWSKLVEELTSDSVGEDLVDADAAFNLSWYANKLGTVPADADLDLWVSEPGGYVGSPGLSVATPNGNFSSPSTVFGSPFESFSLKPQVVPGDYFFVAIFTAPGEEFEVVYPQFETQINGEIINIQRTNSVGELMPMSMQNPLADPIQKIFYGGVSDEESVGILGNVYSNVWFLPHYEVR